MSLSFELNINSSTETIEDNIGISALVLQEIKKMAESNEEISAKRLKDVLELTWHEPSSINHNALTIWKHADENLFTIHDYNPLPFLGHNSALGTWYAHEIPSLEECIVHMKKQNLIQMWGLENSNPLFKKSNEREQRFNKLIDNLSKPYVSVWYPSDSKVSYLLEGSSKYDEEYDAFILGTIISLSASEDEEPFLKFYVDIEVENSDDLAVRQYNCVMSCIELRNFNDLKNTPRWTRYIPYIENKNTFKQGLVTCLCNSNVLTTHILERINEYKKNNALPILLEEKELVRNEVKYQFCFPECLDPT